MKLPELNTAIISLGSNIARREEMVATGLGWLMSIDPMMRESGIYSSEPVSGHGDPYANAVVEIRTAASLDDLVAIAKDFEKACGRDDKARSEKRVPIDVDIVVFNGRVIRDRDYESPFFRRGMGLLRASKEN